MNTVQRHVREIDLEGRRFLESALGQPLRENQQVVIQVFDLDRIPDEQTRQRAHREGSEIAAQGRSHAAASGVTEQEVDEAIQEALAFIRQPNRNAGSS